MMISQFWFRAWLIVAVCFFLVSCSGDASSSEASVPIRIGVDDSSRETANVVVNSFETKNSEQLAYVTVQNRTPLLTALQNGELDCIFVLGESSLTEHFRVPVAHLDIMFIANMNLGISELTYDEVVGIFKGEIGNWQVVSGVNLPIQIISYPAFSSEQVAFDALGISSPPSNALIGTSTEDVIRLAASEPGAVGFVYGSPPVNTVSVLTISYSDSFGPLGLTQTRLPQIPIMFVSLKEPSGDQHTLLDLALNPDTQNQLESGLNK